MKGGAKYDEFTKGELKPHIKKIAKLYKSIIDDKENAPFEFSYYGNRDFYSLVSYLKFRLQHDEITFNDPMPLIEGL